MALSPRDEKRVSSKVFSCLNITVAVVLLVVGVVAWMAGTSVVSMVNEGLVEQKIYFPAADDPTFPAEAYPEAHKLAGKQVTDGALAQVYADEYLGVSSALVGEGKVSSEVGEALAADPTNVALQQQSATMFQLDTSQAVMLNGYGVWMAGKAAKGVGVVALVAGAVLLVMGVMQWMTYKRNQ